MSTASATWRVRSEDGIGEGRPIEPGRLKQAVADGAWSEAAQVRGPDDDRWIAIGDHPQLEEFLPRRPLPISKPAEEAEMDMTPMIDVTFQLIVFFMITATFVVQKTLPVPEASANQESALKRPTISELKRQNIIVKVARDGVVTVDDQQVEPDGLTDALIEASKGRENVELVLDADDAVDYQLVIRVVDAAAGARIEKIHLARRGTPAGE